MRFHFCKITRTIKILYLQVSIKYEEILRAAYNFFWRIAFNLVYPDVADNIREFDKDICKILTDKGFVLNHTKWKVYDPGFWYYIEFNENDTIPYIFPGLFDESHAGDKTRICIRRDKNTYSEIYQAMISLQRWADMLPPKTNKFHPVMKG